LGIGYIGLAHYLAKNHVKYSDKDAIKLVHQLTEAFQFYLLKASNKIAQEKGSCEAFAQTKYADGILPIDTYKKDIDAICKVEYQYDWDWLRKQIMVQPQGIEDTVEDQTVVQMTPEEEAECDACAI
jgi:ribonucleoside-diphosphate reductase alpha chain